MTLTEAIKTGEPFRRPIHHDYVIEDKGLLKWQNTDNPLIFSVASINATDWETASYYAEEYSSGS